MSRALHFLIVLALALPTVVALDPTGVQDDAGTGGDASDSFRTATPVGAGVHRGALAAGIDDADWYLATPAAGERVSLLYVAVEGSFFLEVRGPNDAVAFSGFSSGSTFLWVGSLGVPYRLGFLSDGDLEATYGMDLQLVTPLPQNDGGIPGDASSERASARAVPAGTTSGLLQPRAGDRWDFYAFSPPPNTWGRVTVTPADGASVWVDVYSTVSWIVHWGAADGAPLSILARGPLTGVRLQADTFAQPIAYTLSVEFVTPGPLPQDDAGSGADAPNSVATALPVTLGATYEGRIEFNDGDVWDYYYLDVPTDRVMFTHVVALAGTLRIQIFRPDGVAETSGATFHGPATVFAAGFGPRVVAIRADPSPSPEYGSYRFTTSAYEPHEAALKSVTVDPADADGIRTIRVRVANEGGSPFPAGGGATLLRVQLWWIFGGATTIYQQPVAVDPHSEAEIEIQWDTKTWVGAFRVVTDIIGSRDFDPTNEHIELAQRQSGIVDPGLGTGFGVHRRG